MICKSCGNKFTLSFQSENPSPARGTAEAVPPSTASTISAADSLLILGKLAVKFKYITSEQLSEALAVKKQKNVAGETCHLGQILVDLGMLTGNQRDFLLSVQQMRETRTLDQRFGELALSNGFSSREDLDKALETQKKTFLESKKVLAVGDILVRQGTLTENQRDALLKLQDRLKAPEDSSHKPAPSPAEQTSEEGENQEIQLEVSGDGMLATLSLSSPPSFFPAGDSLPDHDLRRSLSAAIAERRVPAPPDFAGSRAAFRVPFRKKRRPGECVERRKPSVLPAPHGDHPHRLETGQPAQVHSGLGVSSSPQHASLLCDQGEDVSWTDEVIGTG